MPRWPTEDLIRFVEVQVRAFEVAAENKKKGLPSEKPDHPLSESDLRIWLAKERDRKSLTTIARAVYPRAWNKSVGKRGNQLAISRVRNAVIRVEKFLNRDGDRFVYPRSWQRAIDRALEILLLS